MIGESGCTTMKYQGGLAGFLVAAVPEMLMHIMATAFCIGGAAIRWVGPGLWHSAEMAVFVALIHETPTNQFAHAIMKMHRRAHGSRQVNYCQYGCQGFLHGSGC